MLKFPESIIKTAEEYLKIYEVNNQKVDNDATGLTDAQK